MRRKIRNISVFSASVITMIILVGLTSTVNAALVDNGDGTVTDDDLYDGTGLMWLKTAPHQTMTWDEAMDWADNLIFAGYDDWRLPSAIHFETGMPDDMWFSMQNEWGHLYGVEWDNPANLNEILPMEDYVSIYPVHHYWTKTENPGDSSQAYAFFVSYDGIWLNDAKPKSDHNWITAVRGPEPSQVFPSETVLLFDTSGSMSWTHDGERSPPEDEQRLYFAKQASEPYIDLVVDHFPGQTSIGIATFPRHPWNPFLGCQAQIIEPVTIADQSSSSVLKTKINELEAGGNTPLLAGIETASSMFGASSKKMIILLSDGYHNCPSTVNPSDTEVTALIGQLNANSIRVYTIGFGRPTDIDHPLLEAFAEQTGGSFYDVTDSNFNPTSWDPLTALQATYKAILVDWFGLQPVVDPFGSIGADETVTHEVKLNEHDQKVSFYVSWSPPQNGKLNMKITSSDGQPVPTTGFGNRFHEGVSYQILTVGNEYLQVPGKVGMTPWKIEINGNNLTKGEGVKYQYSAISDSLLKLITTIHATSVETGSSLLISAKITEDGLPVTGLTDVTVDIVRPEEGIGNWFATHDVSLGELNKIPQSLDNESFSDKYRKAVYLTDVRNVDFPGRTSTVTLPLYDDGTHGDTNANDGNYTNIYNDTVKEGTYSFHFYASGLTTGGLTFERETENQKYITAVFSPQHSDIKVDLIDDNDDIQRIRLIFTPKDSLGNHLGPGYADVISVNVTWGQPMGELQDNLDGTYSQEFEVPTSVASKADVTVQMGEETKSIIWTEAPDPDESESLLWIIYLLLLLWIITIILAFVLHTKRIRKVREKQSIKDEEPEE
jgi:hypothetical protein